MFNRLIPRSLVGRVFALYSATLIAFVVGGLGLFYQFQFALQLEDAHVRAESLVAVVAPTVADSAVIGDYDTIRRTLDHAIHHSDFASATFIDLKGGVVRAVRFDPPSVVPPDWLRNEIAKRLYDTNRPINAGARDYGVLRLSFAADRIAGALWRQTRYALGLAVLGLLGGLVLIRVPLVHWLGDLGRIRTFEEHMRAGTADTGPALAADAPIEFKQTFDALNRAAATMHAQREQAAVTLAAIGDGVFTLDAEGRIVLANPAACNIVDRPVERLVGKSIAEVLPEVFSGSIDLLPWQIRRSEIHASSTRSVVVDSTLSTIAGSDGRPVGHVLACRDVTEQHRLDERLRAETSAREAALNALRGLLEGLTTPLEQRKTSGGDDIAAISQLIWTVVEQLQERSDQLAAIFELSPDGFVSFDAAGTAGYVSPGFFKLTGLHEDQVLGLSESEFQAVLVAQCPRGGVNAFSFEALRVNEAPGGTRARRSLVELERPTKRVLEAALKQGRSDAISQVLYLRDVTYETEVDDMKSEFLSTAAHELRTPMASIYGFSELMLRRTLSPQRQGEVLETIHRQTTLMIAIVNELLDLARIEARRGKDFNLEVLDLHRLVADVVHDFQPPAQRPVPLLTVPARSALARVDRNKMAQAIGNVLSNAYKYSPDGGSVRVQILFEGSDRVGVQIDDEGIGMTPEQLARVSERFYRADASGNIPGTGLGMSIVKEIVELLGGSLALASEPRRGTRVTLWLPAANTPQVPLETVETMKSITETVP